jgi:LuxR family transcriptional regulator, maltose regulon positive regulatory protein
MRGCILTRISLVDDSRQEGRERPSCQFCERMYEVATTGACGCLQRRLCTGSPFETAHACLELARTLFALGRADAAIEQARRASDILASLGAERATARARTLLAALRNALCTQPDEAGGLDLQTASASPLHSPLVASLPSQRLSPRELEVLRLAAQGLSNQKIADHLVLSQHTIHRHMANILTKLGLPSRAAATAYAAQHGLL